MTDKYSPVKCEKTIVQTWSPSKKEWDPPTHQCSKCVESLKVWWKLGSSKGETLGSLSQRAIQHTLQFDENRSNNITKLDTFEILKSVRIRQGKWTTPKKVKRRKLTTAPELVLPQESSQQVTLKEIVMKLDLLLSLLNRPSQPISVNASPVVSSSPVASVENNNEVSNELSLEERIENLPKKKTKQQRMTKKEEELINDLREDGWTYDAIAKAMKRSKSAVVNRLKNGDQN